MRYFKYQASEPMSKVWMLFKDLGDMTVGQLERIYSGSDHSHTLEIVKSALNGSLLMTDDAVMQFDLSAYEYKCNDNEKNASYKKAKDVLHIVEYDNSEDVDKVGYGDISDRKLYYRDESFDEIVNSAEFEYYIKELYGIRNKYIVEKGIDLIAILCSALRGLPEAVSELKRFMLEDCKIKDLVVSLCENSNDNLLSMLERAVGV